MPANETRDSAEEHADAIINAARDRTCAACRLPSDLDVGIAFLCGAVMLSSATHGKRVPLCSKHERAIDDVATAIVPILAIDAALERIGEPPLLEPLSIKHTFPEHCRACKRSLRLGDCSVQNDRLVCAGCGATHYEST